MTTGSLIYTQAILVLVGISTVVYAAAMMKALQNYRKTKSISNYWLMFAIAVGLGAAFSAIQVLRFLGIAPELLRVLARWIAFLFIVALVYTSIETLTTRIHPTIK